MVWRPLRARLVTHGLAVLLLLTTIVLAVVVPDPFKIADRIGFVIIGVLVAGGLYLLGRCRLRGDAHGLTVTNVLRTTELDWAQVLDATMPPDEPWVTLDLDDGTTMVAMGIQGSDGDRADRALAQLRALITEHSEATSG